MKLENSCVGYKIIKNNPQHGYNYIYCLLFIPEKENSE